MESARKGQKKRVPASVEPVSRQIEVVNGPSSSRHKVSVRQVQVIQLLAHGYTIPEVARKMDHILVPHELNREKRLKKARQRIRIWMATQKMRDLLWEETMIGLDLDSPKIVRGISRKAQAGRVDAARLALEMNGRHAPQAEVQPAQINIAFGDIPRPQRSITDGHDVVDADPDEIVEIEED